MLLDTRKQLMFMELRSIVHNKDVEMLMVISWIGTKEATKTGQVRNKKQISQRE